MPDPFSSDPKDNPFPAIPTPSPDLASLLRTIQAMKATIEILTGVRGDGSNRAILRKEIP